MRISRITKLAYAGALALAALNGATAWLADDYVDRERTAVARQAEFKQLGIDLANASDFLTNEARRYAVSGDKRHFDAYWREVKETKTRDRVVARLKALGAPQAELDLIEEAKRNSDALIATEDAAMKAVAAGDLDQARKLMFGDEYDRDKSIIMQPIAAFQAAMNARATAEAEAAAAAASRMQLASNAATTLTCVAFLAILFLVYSQRVLAPLARLNAAALRIAQQDYATAVPDTARRDEIGELAAAIDSLRQEGIERQRLEAAQAEERAAKEVRAEKIGAVTTAFDEAVSGVLRGVSTAAAELDATAQSMSATAAETSRQAAAAAAGTGQTAANVQTVAAAIEELSASVSEIGRQVAQSNAVADKAAKEAERTNLTVKGLSDAAQRIGEVVRLIGDIASQTNLLALNATIEAARAGEAGKGFAVVASEVKALANQTARATEEIAQQIAAVQEETGQAVQAIGSITGVIGEINDIAATIAAAVEQQGAATQEIARNVREAAEGTGSVSANVDGVSEAAAQTGAASAQVLEAARELSRQSEALNGMVGRFLAEVRAA